MNDFFDFDNNGELDAFERAAEYFCYECATEEDDERNCDYDFDSDFDNE